MNTGPGGIVLKLFATMILTISESHRTKTLLNFIPLCKYVINFLLSDNVFLNIYTNTISSMTNVFF